MNYCLCCHNTLLHHIRNNTAYWYCPKCHQEMPGLFDVEDFHNFLRRSQEISIIGNKSLAHC